MADERRRRGRRGRRRGRGGGHPPDRPEGDQPEKSQPEGSEESDKPEDSPSRFTFRFGRGRDREEEREQEGEEEGTERRPKDREARPTAGAPTGDSPLGFWRRGRARTYRDQPMPKQTVGRTLRRIRDLHVPPWVPVAFIIVVVFAILGALFFVQGAAGKPRIQDHWHATYQVLICGQRQPNFPTWDAPEGVHTHADGIIHIHPFIPAGEGAGARLVKWFEYGGGKLTQTEMRMPGDREEFENGQTCDDGTEAMLQVFVDSADNPAGFEKMDNWGRYIPQDGDQVRIVFGPEEGTVVEGEGIKIAVEEATREISIEAGDRGVPEADSFFNPNAFAIAIDETVKVNVTNTGTVTHNLRVQGVDAEYETDDDFVTEPLLITPGEEGFTVVRIVLSGEYAFRCDIHPAVQFGALTVEGDLAEETPEPDATPDGTPAGGTGEDVDVTFDVAMGDNFFESGELELEAGQSFRINLINEGELVHNLRIAGPDGDYETADDLVSTPSPLLGGETGELIGQIDEPGVYSFRSDFQPVEMTGTITAK